MLSCAVGGTSGIRLDWNESPFGPSPEAVGRVVANAHDLHRYPRGLLGQVTEEVAHYHGVGPDCVLLTNGVDEAVDLALSLVASAWFVVPGFDGYADRARAGGKPTRPIPLDDAWEPTVLPHELARRGVVFLAQPHSPTGNMFRQDWVRQVVATAELTFLDTTYIDFAGVPLVTLSFEEHPELLVFQSFSKAFGLAGIRLGALIGEPGVIAALRDRQRFHSVDSIALHAAAGALDDLDHKSRLCHHVKRERPRYVATLRKAAVFGEVRDTQANFVLARCRNGWAAHQIVASLGAHGVWVRDCSSLGLHGWLRITVGTSNDLRQLSEALEAVWRFGLLASAEPAPA